MLNNRMRVVSMLMLIISILTVIVSLVGVFHSEIYRELMNGEISSDFIVAGSVNQDLLSIVCGLALCVVVLFMMKTNNYKLLIVALGLTGYIFYGYALYTFGRMLTPLYLVYIFIFAVSVYGLILGVLSFDHKQIVQQLRLARGIRVTSGMFLLLISISMSMKWMMDVLPSRFTQMENGMYLILALDLGFVLPACGVFGIMIIKNRGYGILFSTIALIKVFTLGLSVVIGTFVAPHFGLKPDQESFTFFGLLSFISLFLIVLQLKGTHVSD